MLYGKNFCRAKLITPPPPKKSYEVTSQSRFLFIQCCTYHMAWLVLIPSSTLKSNGEVLNYKTLWARLDSKMRRRRLWGYERHRLLIRGSGVKARGVLVQLRKTFCGPSLRHGNLPWLAPLGNSAETFGIFHISYHIHIELFITQNPISIQKNFVTIYSYNL